MTESTDNQPDKKVKIYFEVDSEDLSTALAIPEDRVQLIFDHIKSLFRPGWNNKAKQMRSVVEFCDNNQEVIFAVAMFGAYHHSISEQQRNPLFQLLGALFGSDENQ